MAAELILDFRFQISDLIASVGDGARPAEAKLLCGGIKLKHPEGRDGFFSESMVILRIV